MIERGSNLTPKGNPNIKEISKTRYIGDTNTAKVVKKEKNNYRDNYNANWQVFHKAKLILLANFKAPEMTSFFTLKYATPMFDYDQLAKDMEAFFKKLRRNHKNNSFKYVYSIEFSVDGSFHIHCILFWKDTAPKGVSSFWEKGSSYEEPIINEVGFINLVLYLTYYKSVSKEEFERVFPGKNIEEIASQEYISGETPQEIKQLIKIARFYLFPVGKKPFPHSIGMKEEIIKDCKSSDCIPKQFICEKTSSNEINGVSTKNTYRYFKVE